MFESVFCRVPRFGLLAVCLLLTVVLNDRLAFAQADGDDQNGDQRAAPAMVPFAKAAKPFLTKYCLRCHNEQERESGIRVDQFDGQLAESMLKLWEEVGDFARNRLNHINPVKLVFE